MHNPTLLMVALSLGALLAAIWLIGGLVLKVARKATLHWAVSNAVLGGAVTLLYQRGHWHDSLAFFGSDVAVLLGYLAVRRGVQVFTSQRPSDLEHAVLLVAGIPALGWLRAMPAVPAQQAAVLLTALLSSYAMWRATQEAYHCMRQDFDRTTSIATVLPIFVIGLLLLGRAVLNWAFPSGGDAVRDATRGAEFGLFLLAAILAQMLQSLSLAGLVIARLIARIRRLSVSDVLTGAANRRRLEDVLGAEMARRRRTGRPLSLAVLDIDHFKHVNDAHGHAAGDAALAATAALMRRLSRTGDLVARLGGEEFCVVLPDTDLAGAAIAVERLRRALEQEMIVFEGKRLHLSASFGVAVCGPREEGWSDLLKRADAALYRAKARGRNCVETAPAEPERVGAEAS
ncbi:GGDEF domain-containing protein [Schlegelella sp. S2-27]|uniref:diguanylate cyclase n=1 Tax=Caldimonas mangrovi TaxID=2944811 RepID=A0ABT0YKQ0_9BURK|nr:GGDEF domain-containing protein [Caldimonas mangrovi]MCM5679313.1 GGDEF domain-containing protein [Caldimonas mangrovi]